MDDMAQQYHDLHLPFKQELNKVFHDTDLGRITYEKSDRMVNDIQTRRHAKVLQMFNSLSWEEQIQFSVICGFTSIIEKLDQEQLTAYRILKD